MWMGDGRTNVRVIPTGSKTFSRMKVGKSWPEVRSTMTAASPNAVLL